MKKDKKSDGNIIVQQDQALDVYFDSLFGGEETLGLNIFADEADVQVEAKVAKRVEKKRADEVLVVDVAHKEMVNGRGGVSQSNGRCPNHEYFEAPQSEEAKPDQRAIVVEKSVDNVIYVRATHRVGIPESRNNKIPESELEPELEPESDYIFVDESIQDDQSIQVDSAIETDIENKKNIQDSNDKVDERVSISELELEIEKEIEKEIVSETDIKVIAHEVIAIPQVQNEIVSTSEPIKKIDEVILTESIAQDCLPEWANKVFQTLIFNVNEVPIALRLLDLQSIERWDGKCTHLPGTPDWFIGLINYRGRKVCIVDTLQLIMPEKRQLFDDESRLKDYKYILYVYDGRWGIVCNSINEIFNVKPGDVKWRINMINRPCFWGTIKETMVAIMDMDEFKKLLKR